MTPWYILKRTFTKVNLLNYPNNLGGGCYLANRITTKLHLHFPLPHYNDTVLYSKTNFYKSSTIWGGAISQTGLPQNSISTSPSPITMTPCYILKRTFTKVNLLNYPNNWGGAISQTGSPQNSISTSPSPITMTPCYILKRSLTKVNLLNTPDTWGGGAISRNRATTKLHPFLQWRRAIFVLYSKTNFNKSQPPRFPQHLGGGAITQTGLPQNSHLHFPPYNNVVLYFKTIFYKRQPPQFPQQLGGGYLTNRTTTKLHLPSLQWCRATF